ncbi:putative transmembrane domain protein, partial [Chlamydia psittaci 84-8471/1]
FRAIFKFSR